MVRLTIDGKEVAAKQDQTILDVARENSIYIPTLCYHDRLSLIKSCRICLVDVEGAEMPMASCATPVVDGMVVRTRTERVEKMRLDALKLLLVNHPLDCPVCDAGGECQLQNRTVEFGIEQNVFPAEKREIPPTMHRPIFYVQRVEASTKLRELFLLSLNNSSIIRDTGSPSEQRTEFFRQPEQFSRMFFRPRDFDRTPVFGILFPIERKANQDGKDERKRG